MNGAVQLRRADAGDAVAMADVWIRSFTAASPTVRRAHDDDDVRGWMAGVVLPGLEAWVATSDAAVVGLMALSSSEIEQLYLDPPWRGRGVGDGLVMLAKTRRPGGLELWTFQVNRPARRFYERHGFEPIRFTDGRDNEEREPDVRYRWRP